MNRLSWRRAALLAAVAVPAVTVVTMVLPTSASVASYRVSGGAVGVQVLQGSLVPGTFVFNTLENDAPVAATAADSSPHADALGSILYVGGAVNGPAEALAGALLDAELGSAANPTPVKSSPIDVTGVAPYTMYASSDSGNRVDDRGATPRVPGSAPPFHLNAASYATHADAGPVATATVAGAGLGIDQLQGSGTGAAQAGIAAGAARLRDAIAAILTAHGDLLEGGAAAATPTSGPFLSVASEIASSDARRSGSTATESASSVLGDVELLGGLIQIGSISVIAAGSTDGTKVPAPATGTATLGEVTVAGMPATITAHGIQVVGGASPDVLATINSTLGAGLAGLGVGLSADSSTTLQKTLGKPSTAYTINGLVVSYALPGAPPVFVSLAHANLFLGAQPAPALSVVGGSASLTASGAAAPAVAPATGSGGIGSIPALSGATPARPAAPLSTAPSATASPPGVTSHIVYVAADLVGRRPLLTLAGLAEALLLAATLVAAWAARRAVGAVTRFDPELML